MQVISGGGRVSSNESFMSYLQAAKSQPTVSHHSRCRFGILSACYELLVVLVLVQVLSSTTGWSESSQEGKNQRIER